MFLASVIKRETVNTIDSLQSLRPWGIRIRLKKTHGWIGHISSAAIPQLETQLVNSNRKQRKSIKRNEALMINTRTQGRAVDCIFFQSWFKLGGGIKIKVIKKKKKVKPPVTLMPRDDRYYRFTGLNFLPDFFFLCGIILSILICKICYFIY